MKVYLSVDMEGVSNVVMTHQLFPSGYDHALPEIRELVTREVNAIVEGAFDGGATEVVVNENHSGKEIIPELLDRRGVLLYGKPKFLYTAEGVEGFDTMMLAGIHAKPGTKDAVMAHSWIPKALYDFRVNGVSMGEIGLNALAAGHWGIPVSLVSGDQATCDEARELLGEVEAVAVKRGSGGFAAYCPHPEAVRQELKEAARRALEEHSRFAPYTLEKPLRMEFDFVTHHQALMVALIPGAEMMSPRTVAFTVKDFYEGMKIFIVAGYVSSAETDSFY